MIEDQRRDIVFFRDFRNAVHEVVRDLVKFLMDVFFLQFFQDGNPREASERVSGNRAADLDLGRTVPFDTGREHVHEF